MTPGNGYGARALVRDVRARFRDGWHRIPDDDRGRWVRLAAAGTVAMFVLMFAMVEIGKALDAAGSLSWETGFLRWLVTDGPMSFSTAVWLQTFGTDITLWILVLLTAGIALWNGRPITALSIVLAYVVIDPVVRFGWILWDRARPDVLYDGFASPGFHSFPSGHTGKTFAVYGLLIAQWVRSAPGWLEKGSALVLLALIGTVVPFGRMSMGVHWPSDVIAGWLLGAIWLVYLLVLTRYENPAPAAQARLPRSMARSA